MHPEQDPANEASLQFDRVEMSDSESSGQTGAQCTSCRQPVTGYYYQANGGVVCVPCREKLGAALTGGSGLMRLIKGLTYGTFAAAGGAGLYFAVLKLTGYEVGLIAIVVGLMVGAAVRAGSENRGGWLYQCIAVGLTYLAIVTTYVPLVYPMLAEQATEDIRGRLATAPAETEADVAGLAIIEGTDVKLTPVHKGILLALAVVLSFISPFLEFNIIGYLIIGFGLYEAWKLTKRAKLDVAGPFLVGAEDPAAPVPVS